MWAPGVFRTPPNDLSRSPCLRVRPGGAVGTAGGALCPVAPGSGCPSSSGPCGSRGARRWQCTLSPVSSCGPRPSRSARHVRPAGRSEAERPVIGGFITGLAANPCVRQALLPGAVGRAARLFLPSIGRSARPAGRGQCHDMTIDHPGTIPYCWRRQLPFPAHLARGGGGARFRQTSAANSPRAIRIRVTEVAAWS